MREGRAPPLRFSLCAAANRRADDIRPYGGAVWIRPDCCARRGVAARAIREAPLRSSFGAAVSVETVLVDTSYFVPLHLCH